VFSTFTSNKDTAFGISKEEVAIKIFQEENPKLRIITNVGLIINRILPWMGFSPDGFIVNEDGTLTLLEVKSLKAGKKFTGVNFCKKVSCLLVNEHGVQMKKRHKFYGQIQLSLALGHLSQAKLLLYVHKNRSVISVDVPIDIQFLEDYIPTLTRTYFDYYLPFIHANKERLSK